MIIVLVTVLVVVVGCFVRFLRSEEKSCEQTKITKLEEPGNDNNNKTCRPMFRWWPSAGDIGKKSAAPKKPEQYMVDMETVIKDDCLELPNIIASHVVSYPPPPSSSYSTNDARNAYAREKRNSIYSSPPATNGQRNSYCPDKGPISQFDLVSFPGSHK